MSKLSSFYGIIIATLLTFALSGCQKLQPGYYLTPENYPGEVEYPTPVPPTEPPVQPTLTPPSTVQGIPTRTLTPLPTPAASPTLAPTATKPLSACTETEGQIIADSYISQRTGEELRYRVYLPPCYEQSGARYPTVYMLHGLGAGMDDSQLDRMGLNEAADTGYIADSLPPMIIIMPNGIDGDHHLHGSGAPYPDIITDELVPLIDEEYCTIPDRTYRAIGGLSRGGFWASWIALSHPEMFSRVGGHSAYLYDPEYASDKNPNNIIDTAEGIETLTMYYDHGGEGREITEVQPGIQAFIQRLEARDVTVTYIQNPTGDHTEAYWSKHVTEYLTFYGETWLQDASALPSCQTPGETTSDG